MLVPPAVPAFRTSRRRAVRVAFAALAAAVAADGRAQAYPARPIRWLIPFSAGGPTDVLARAIAPRLSESLGVPVLVDNRVGAGGAISMEALAKAAPDGYTIGVAHSGTQSINPFIVANLPYDPQRDFAPITPMVSYVNLLIVHPSVPVKTVAELVEFAKANPDRATFASGGIGTSNHLAGELLKTVTGAPMVHVPYKGSGPALVDVMAGNVTCMFDILVTALPQVRNGKVNALAVTSARRSPYAPDIPTMAESGVPGYAEAGNDLWFGVFGPAGLPREIVERLHREFVKALNAPDVQEKIRAQAYTIWTSSPEEFAAFLRTDRQKWERVVRAAQIKGQ